MNELKNGQLLTRGSKQVYNMQESDYMLGREHGEIFITDWSVDRTNISGIIRSIYKHAKSTWSIACVEEYDFRVTVRFLDKKDADWFEDSDYNRNFERKYLV